MEVQSFVLITTEVAEDHTSENLEIVQDTIMKEWANRQTVVATIADYGSKLIKAVRELDFFNIPRWTHIKFCSKENF